MFNIIPQPVSILINQSEKGFTLHTGTTISPYSFTEDLIKFSKKQFGKKIIMHEDTGEERSIILKLDDSIEHEEGYTIKCENRRAFINAKTESGLFYGLQTLKQILLQTDGKIPHVEITDYPRFAYRGYMLDCGRYFYTVDEIKRIVDLMALHKLNVLHWHLTEDQGWRVEIKKYPLLTEKGSKRSHTNFNNKPHGGYYTQDDIREIVAYCHERKIKVIPEFDVPGHMVAAISCYPYLSCLDRDLEVATHWGVKHDILCAGKESSYQFVYDVLDELMDLFPDKVIHIGGDEAVKMRWKNCPHCQKAIEENGLKDEDDLQMFFMSKVNEYLESKGYSSIMWNYDTTGGTEDTTVPDESTPTNEELRLNRKDITFSYKGESWVLYSGGIAKNLITWSSDDENIVTFVDGKAVAVGNGMTEVHAEYAGAKVSCIIRCKFTGTAGVVGNGGVSEDGGGSTGNGGVSEDGGSTSSKTGTITKNGVNVRKGPSVDYDKNGLVNSGDVVSIIETQKGTDGRTWAKIGVDKWVSMEFIKTN